MTWLQADCSVSVLHWCWVLWWWPCSLCSSCPMHWMRSYCNMCSGDSCLFLQQWLWQCVAAVFDPLWAGLPCWLVVCMVRLLWGVALLGWLAVLLCRFGCAGVSSAPVGHVQQGLLCFGAVELSTVEAVCRQCCRGNSRWRFAAGFCKDVLRQYHVAGGVDQLQSSVLSCA